MMRTVSLAVLLAVTIAAAQWSEPAVVATDTWPPYLEDPALVIGPGDTVWVFYVAQHYWDDTSVVQARWSTGDTWSPPDTLVKSWLLHALGVGVDPQQRIWVSWYNGDYLIDPPPDDTWGIWTRVRDAGVWSEPELALKGPDSVVMRTPAGQSFAADREGNWYMGIAELTEPFPDLYSSAMYSRLDGDTWTHPRYIAEGWGSPVSADNYLPTLVAHPDSGFWSVHDHASPRYSAVQVNQVVSDTVYEVGEMSPNRLHEATRDSTGILLIASRDDSFVWCTFCEQGSSHSEGVSEEDDLCARPFRPQICYDSLGWIWVGWTSADTSPVVSYKNGNGWWSDAEPVTDSTGVLLDLATDTNGRVYALFCVDPQRWYTTYREVRPGVAEQWQGSGVRATARPTVVRATLRLPGTCSDGRQASSVLLDVSGRRVMDLAPGDNDVSRLAPGVYFLVRPSAVGCKPPAVQKVVIGR